MGTASEPEQQSAWPAWATEPVEIVEADAAWAALGEARRRELADLLARWLVSDVHHIGSTAVPGLAAKPIVDLMAGVADLGQAEEIAAALAPHGWHWVPPELDERPWRRFFIKVADGRRRAHLHLMLPDAQRWGEQLRFRDRLRADSGLAGGYADLKRRLAREHPDDREAYTRAKAAFVGAVLAGAPTPL